MTELILNWANLAAVVAIGTILMLILFAFSAIIVNHLSEDHFISKAIIIVFSILNALYNLTLGTLLCLDPPGRLGEPSTQRLQRYKRIYDDSDTGIRKWRLNVARTVCWWLNIFDPRHC